MKIQILFNTDARYKGLCTGWGISFLINKTILFDTGEKGAWLLYNMRKLRVDTGELDAVIISHDHWDHTGGLWDLLKRKPDIRVYCCPGFSREFKDAVCRSGAGLVETAGVTEIAENIFVSGGIPFTYKNARMVEQALFVNTANGISVITGCAHPGITAFIRKAQKVFPGKRIYLAAGGFHLMNSSAEAVKKVIGEFKKFRVKKAGPTHCTGSNAQGLFRVAYKKDYITITTGKSLII
jgi:7,8-dihydropterin-6-yl-methyl-4-(beta-D-ribofuranosyl)aminobenzene 5'-phosphate synthase